MGAQNPNFLALAFLALALAGLALGMTLHGGPVVPGELLSPG